MVKYHSEMSQTQRKEAKELFINGSARIKVASQRGIGVGVNYQHCSYAIFLELDYIPGNIEQCVRRVYRFGSNKPVLIQFLVVKDSFDEHMLNSLNIKQQQVNELIKQTQL